MGIIGNELDQNTMGAINTRKILLPMVQNSILVKHETKSRAMFGSGTLKKYTHYDDGGRD